MSQTLINAYIAQLTPQEKKVLKIAMEHLETSFNLVKSIGFQQWQAQQPPHKEQAQQPKEQAQQPHKEQAQQPPQAQAQPPHKEQPKGQEQQMQAQPDKGVTPLHSKL